MTNARIAAAEATRSIAGLGAGGAQRYFAPELDRSNRLTGWLVRIEAVVIKKVSRPISQQRRTARRSGR
jgi:hypothetical protein